MKHPMKLVVAGLTAAVVATTGFLVGSTLIAAGMAPLSQGKGGGCGPGPIKCNSDQLDASAFWQSEDLTSFVSFSANRGSFVVRPRGGPAIVTPPETMVFVSFATPTIAGSNCFVVPDSAFVISRDIQSASLHVTLTGDMQCFGFATPLFQDIGAIPAAGGGGGSGGDIPLPLGVDVTWKGPGLPFAFTTTSSEHCGGFTATFQLRGLSSQAIANGSFTVPDPTVPGHVITTDLGPTNFAGADQISMQQISNGVPGSLCTI